jgi:hypothetical protein
MSKPLEQILNYEVLCGVIKQVKAGIPFALPKQLLVSHKKIEGNTGTLDVIKGTRQAARILQYGSPSQKRALTGRSKKAVTLMHSFEHQVHDPLVLQNLRSSDGTKQLLGRNEITSQTANFNQLFDNLRYASIYNALANGKIHFNEDGNLLNSSSGAMTTIDFEIPDGHQDQLDVFGDGDLLTSKWSQAATKIHKQIKAIRDAALRKTGYPIKYAFYGNNIPDYLLNNTALQKVIEGNPAYQQGFADGGVPKDFLKLEWIPASEGAFFVDADGDINDVWDDDLVVFAPEITQDWYDVIEGSYLVPKSLGKISSDAVAAVGDVAQVFGKFQYAKILDDPVSIKHLAGDTFLPFIKNPWAIFQAKVTWS